MRMNCKVLTMALGGAMIPWGLATAADNLPFPKNLTSVGSLSDKISAGESTTLAPQRPVLSLDQRPAAFRENTVDESSSQTGKKDQVFHSAGYSVALNESTPMPIPDGAPMMSTAMTSGSMSSGHIAMPTSGCATGNCGSGSCGSGACGHTDCSSCSTGLSCGSCRKRGWFSVEAILWWGPETRTEDLVVSGPRFSVPSTVELGGVEGFDGLMMPGMRTDFGRWIDDCESIGIGGRLYGLFSEPSTYSFTSDGSRSLGVPFYNPSLGFSGGPDVQLVAIDTNGNGINTGSIDVTSDTDFLSADAYGKLLLARSACSRADLIGGYTFARFDSSIALATSTIDNIGNNGILNGTRLQTSDLWSTRNEFHGGHVGFTTDIGKGRLSLTTLGKVAIGTMQQSGFIGGESRTTSPTGNVSVANGGIFSLESNRGNYSRDVLAFMPEAGAKLKYCMKPNMFFSVGYTFLFLSDVVTAADMMDLSRDPLGANIGDPSRPLQKFDHGTYYLHGVDLGLNFTY